MIINRRTITMEMTEGEHSEVSLSLKKYAEHCHVSLLLSEIRENTSKYQIEFAERNLESAVRSYEMFSGRSYDMYVEEFKIRDRIPSLRKRF